MNSPIAMVKGQLDAGLSPFDRGLLYGDGLFETLRVCDGRLPLWSRHLARLKQSARLLGIALDDLDQQLTEQLPRLLAAASARWQAPSDRLQAHLKILLTRGEGGRGYRSPDQPRPTLCLQLFPRVLEAPGRVKCLRCTQPLLPSPLPGLKHCNRLQQVLAAQELAGSDCFEGLLSDAEGRLVEGISSNVLAVRGQALLVPPLAAGGVAGVMRQWLLEQWPAQGGRLLQAELPLAALHTVDELLIANSNWGALSVAELVDAEFGRQFPATDTGRALLALAASAFQPAAGDWP